MGILERYIQRELIKPFLVVLVILVGLFATFSGARFLSQAISQSLGIASLLYLVFLETLIALEVLLPASLFIAVILGLGRMHRDQEMLIMQSAGIGTSRVLYAVLLFALPVTIASGMLSVHGRPWAYAETFALERQAEAELNTNRFQAGRFYGDAVGENTVIHLQERDRSDGLMREIFYYTREPDGSRLIMAREASRETVPGQNPRLRLFDGLVYELTETEEGVEDTRIRFEEMVYTSGAGEATDDRPKAKSTASLWSSGRLQDIAELQWRLSRPVAALLIVLVAVSLSRSSPRREHGGKSLLAALVFAVYYNLTGVARNWVAQGSIAPIPGIWWVYLLMFTLAMGLLAHDDRGPGLRFRIPGIVR